eukprot:gnl/MRDRNA2_/MRDRNA2_28690_c0_seq1.p1 gnl/MRDRNA2_/MRDRNA2_28690_c0~~gnl/MRDRNA2_/MRDRNA2_28690_c0_seq1.p1  ORF type:complete len:1160 (+),score=215.30 gnl/MRDRNA2_/MRDRNA2_28690_c0_seq1:391-3480(+)
MEALKEVIEAKGHKINVVVTDREFALKLKASFSKDGVLKQDFEFEEHVVSRGAKLLDKGKRHTVKEHFELDISNLPLKLQFRLPAQATFCKKTVWVQLNSCGILQLASKQSDASNALPSTVSIPFSKCGADVNVEIILKYANNPVKTLFHPRGTRLQIEDGDERRESTLLGYGDDGDADVRLDGNLTSEPLGNRTHRAAGVYRYACGQALMIFLGPGFVGGNTTVRLPIGGRWLDAVIIKSPGPNEGNRHEMFVSVTEGSREQRLHVSIDVNSINHSPAWLKAADYERAARRYEQTLISQHSYTHHPVTRAHLDVTLLNFDFSCEASKRPQDEVEAVLALSSQREQGLHKSPCLIVLGAPSSGKTSLCKRLAMSCIRKRNGLVPLLMDGIGLAEVAKKRPGRDLIEELIVLRYSKGTKQHLMLRQALCARRIVIIIDGLDEGLELEPWIEDYVLRLGRSGQRVVCTSQPENGRKLQANHFKTLRLMPLSKEAQCRLAEAAMDTDGEAKSFMTALAEFPAHVGHPLLFYMFVHYARMQNGLPQREDKCKESMVYERVIFEMLNTVQQRQVVSEDVESRVHVLERELQAIAIGALREGLSDFTKNDAIRWARMELPESVTQTLETRGEKLLLNCFKPPLLPLLSRARGGGKGVDKSRYRFVHPCLQEHLAACHAAYCFVQGRLDVVPSLESILFDPHWERFLTLLFERRTLRVSINLSGKHRVSVQSAQTLARYLRRACAIRSVELGGGNHIGAKGARHIARALRTNTCLEYLSLPGNGIGDSGTRRLALALRQNTTLQVLDISSNGISHVGARHLAESLAQNRGLLQLVLESNEDIGDVGAQSLAEGLERNGVLQEIVLVLSGVGLAGALRLSRALQPVTQVGDAHSTPGGTDVQVKDKDLEKNVVDPNALEAALQFPSPRRSTLQAESVLGMDGLEMAIPPKPPDSDKAAWQLRSVVLRHQAAGERPGAFDSLRQWMQACPTVMPGSVEAAALRADAQEEISEDSEEEKPTAQKRSVRFSRLSFAIAEV